MREQIKDKEHLNHIIESIDNIFEFTTDLTFSDFDNDKMLKFAVIKNLEIIGEACNLLTKEIKENYSDIEWQAIIGLRHVLVHGYYQISNTIIWNTITEDLLPFKTKIKKIRDKL